MIRVLKLILTIMILINLFSVITYSHPGKTDEDGGHYDRSDGTYHYHHGYPAHDHVDGICPYDYHDAVMNSIGTDSKGTSLNTSHSSTAITITTQKISNIAAVTNMSLGSIAVMFIIVAVFLLFTHYCWRRRPIEGSQKQLVTKTSNTNYQPASNNACSVPQSSLHNDHLLDEAIQQKIFDLRKRSQFKNLPIFHEFSKDSLNNRLYSAAKEKMKLANMEVSCTIISESNNIYKTTLSSCTCKDFEIHRKPCKHMYRLAIEIGLLIDSPKEWYLSTLTNLKDESENFKKEKTKAKRIE